MAILLQHPEHGFYHVYSDLDLKEHETIGWMKVEDEKPKEAITEIAKQVESFKCGECGKQFAMKMHLNNHLRSHKR